MSDEWDHEVLPPAAQEILKSAAACARVMEDGSLERKKEIERAVERVMLMCPEKYRDDGV